MLKSSSMKTKIRKEETIMIDIHITDHEEAFFAAYTKKGFGIFTKYNLGKLLCDADRCQSLHIVQFNSYRECLEHIAQQYNNLGGNQLSAAELLAYFGEEFYDKYYLFCDIPGYYDAYPESMNDTRPVPPKLSKDEAGPVTTDASLQDK